MWLIDIILRFVGLVTIVWFVCMAREEYKKIRQEERNRNGQS